MLIAYTDKIEDKVSRDATPAPQRERREKLWPSRGAILPLRQALTDARFVCPSGQSAVYHRSCHRLSGQWSPPALRLVWSLATPPPYVWLAGKHHAAVEHLRGEIKTWLRRRG
ncbi:hypothetical protein RRG08_063783 [Elysia crispata]|uniref:Uncharacterized protein n=1 Tax=Elysia crispata TaxID=231223 RepID=A0AAE1AJZ8_9GAST|nr:hypothetical protein RRG08_063783 [Elysia crispata]